MKKFELKLRGKDVSLKAKLSIKQVGLIMTLLEDEDVEVDGKPADSEESHE